MKSMVGSSWSNVDLTGNLFQQVHTSFTRWCPWYQMSNSGLCLMPDCITHHYFLQRKCTNVHQCQLSNNVIIISLDHSSCRPDTNPNHGYYLYSKRNVIPMRFTPFCRMANTNWMEGRSILHLWTEKAGSIGPIINPLVSSPSHQPLRPLTNCVRSHVLGWYALGQ